ncbi:MAG: hypothetical protein AAGA18_14340 [Verrucomicrobiota bacterium]
MWDGDDWTSYTHLTTSDAIEEKSFDIIPISSVQVKALVRRRDALGTRLSWWTLDPTGSYRSEDEVIFIEGSHTCKFAAIPEFYHDDAKVMFFEKTDSNRVRIYLHGDSGFK